MAKFFGKIGYVGTVETKPGVWRKKETEREYYGELIRNSRRYESSNKVNDDLNISNEISIIADQFANENLYMMKWVEFMGAKWKIISVDIRYPRLILTVGGVYNEQEE